MRSLRRLARLPMKSLYRRRFPRLASLWRLVHFLDAVARLSCETVPCHCYSTRTKSCASLSCRSNFVVPGRLLPTSWPTSSRAACLRFQAHHPSAKARIIRLVESGAFADATLALIELELPQWKLRRLICDDGEWHCAFSKQLALRRARRDGRSHPRNSAIGDPERVRRSAASQPHCGTKAGRGPCPAGPTHTGSCRLLRQFRLIGCSSERQSDQGRGAIFNSSEPACSSCDPPSRLS